jgi:hypothetical protein
MSETTETRKKRVFLSWSGNRSLAMAATFHDWLPRVLPMVDSWISEDIPKGSEWRPALMREVRNAGAAIACLTAENHGSDWLHFEAGVATRIDPEGGIFPITLDSEKVSGPLQGFQLTRSWVVEDVQRLVRTLNRLMCAPPLPDTWINEQVRLLWDQLVEGLTRAKQLVPDKSDDYEDAIKYIREYLKTLQETGQVDIVTFYVRDYATPSEAIDYYIESALGLRDPAPMFGPIVYDDFRNRKEREVFTENKKAKMESAKADAIEGRAKKFVGREEIVANATFRHVDADCDVRALLNLNWRSDRKFTAEEKQRWRDVANSVFGLLPNKPFISLVRARMLTKELRARRYLGSAELDGAPDADPHRRIRQALTRFFGPQERDLAIHIVSLENEVATKWEDDGAGMPCTVEPDWKWVKETTKPLFYQSDIDAPGPGRRDRSTFIVPMRVPPGLRTCNGIMLISERDAGLDVLESAMVRPLCSLGDTFGEILRTSE